MNILITQDQKHPITSIYYYENIYEFKCPYDHIQYYDNFYDLITLRIFREILDL